MKNILTCLLSLWACVHGYAQTVLHVEPATEWFVRSGTTVSLNGLVLTPSVNFTLPGHTLSRNPAVTLPAANPTAAINRAYFYSHTLPPFSGTLRMHYADGELHGLPENELILNIHNGTRWDTVSLSAQNMTGNYLESILDNALLHEITITSSNAILPLKWGAITAQRSDNGIKISFSTLYEQALSHFDVERAEQPHQWKIIRGGIPASNRTQGHTYIVYDTLPSGNRLSYRIRQTDLDGKNALSSIVSLPAIVHPSVSLYPNPALHSFRIRIPDVSILQSVSLHNSSGMLLKTWDGYHPVYTLPPLPKGMYPVTILLTNGERFTRTLVK